MTKANPNNSAIKNVKEYGKFSLLFYVVVAIFFVIYYSAFIAIALTFPSTLKAHSFSTLSSLAASTLLVVIGIGAIVVAVAFIIVLFILFIVSLSNVREAFTILSKVNKSSFEQPLEFVNLMIVFLIIGVLVLALGMGLSSLITMAFAAALFVIAFVLGQYGIALGLWRFGSSYENTILKVGSIFAPFTNVPGILLVYLGAEEIERQEMQKK